MENQRANHLAQNQIEKQVELINRIETCQSYIIFNFNTLSARLLIVPPAHQGCHADCSASIASLRKKIERVLLSVVPPYPFILW